MLGVIVQIIIRLKTSTFWVTLWQMYRILLIEHEVQHVYDETTQSSWINGLIWYGWLWYIAKIEHTTSGSCTIGPITDTTMMMMSPSSTNENIYQFVVAASCACAPVITYINRSEHRVFTIHELKAAAVGPARPDNMNDNCDVCARERRVYYSLDCAKSNRRASW